MKKTKKKNSNLCIVQVKSHGVCFRGTSLAYNAYTRRVWMFAQQIILFHAARPPDVRARRPLVPVQTETTTDRAFGRPVMPALWRRPPSVHRGSASPAETLTVHRASYRPFGADPQAATAAPTCIGCACQGNTAKPRRTVGVPVESHTTYATHYRGGARHERPGRDDSPTPESCPSLRLRPSRRNRRTTTTAAAAADVVPRAHDYTV